MKTLSPIKAAIGAVAVTFAVSSQAQTLPECLSTPLVQFDGSIVDAAIATPELSTLVDAVVAAGLDGALATTPNLTVYAPTNDAFAALPGNLVETALGNTDLLTAILTYHVTPSMQDPRRYVNGFRRNTLQGTPVFYHRMNGMAMINGAGMSCQGVKTDNGVVWVIDKVLIP
jgi:uncharacterized surface protein with fasciclin (FAS1) repeats